MLIQWLKKHWKLCLLSFCVFIIAVPLLINILFKIHSTVDFIVAEWDASAALIFYGALLAAGITVFGVYLTIQYSRENYKEDVRNRVLPFIVIEMLKTKSHKTFFASNTEDDEATPEGYVEYKLQDYYCILNDGKIEYKTGLTSAQKQLLQNGGTEWVSEANGGRCIVVDDICVPIEIENVGNGTAINFRYGLNRTNVAVNERKFLPVISLKAGGTLMFYIFSEDCGKNSNNHGEYVLLFVYEDIYKNRYEQKFDVSIEYSEEHNAPVFSINMDHMQTLTQQEDK